MALRKAASQASALYSCASLCALRGALSLFLLFLSYHDKKGLIHTTCPCVHAIFLLSGGHKTAHPHETAHTPYTNEHSVLLFSVFKSPNEPPNTKSSRIKGQGYSLTHTT